MRSPQPMQNNLYHEWLSIKRSRSKEISFSRLSLNAFLTPVFSQRLSHYVFLTTSYSQRLSHNIFLTLLRLHIGPHNVVLIKSQYSRNPSVLYKYPKMSQICLSSDPCFFIIFCWSNWNLHVAHLQYIFCHCMKFQNPRTEASCQRVADKLLYKYPKYLKFV